MTDPRGGSVPGLAAPVTVITGSEELLVARAVDGVLAAARAADPAVELRDIGAGELTDADLLDLSSPSLFADPRVVVIRGAADLAEAQRAALLAWAGDPLPGVALVLVQGAGVKGKRTVDALRAGGAEVIVCPAVTRTSDRLAFVQNEARAAGLAITAGACRALVEAVGSDLRELASATAQLVTDTRGPIDEAAVARFHRGRAQTGGFDVADAALAGHVAEGLARLAAALESGTAPVLVNAAVASGLRDLARVRGAGPGGPAAIAAAVGLPTWKVDKALRAGRGWTDEAIAAAVRAVADADAQVKGAGVDAAFALERMVARVAGLRAAR